MDFADFSKFETYTSIISATFRQMVSDTIFRIAFVISLSSKPLKVWEMNAIWNLSNIWRIGALKAATLRKFDKIALKSATRRTCAEALNFYKIWNDGPEVL